jgi:two-component system cell cycle sensor histidine kinase/response regulator CckA
MTSQIKGFLPTVGEESDAAIVQEYYTKLIRGTAHNLNNVLTIFHGYLSIIEMEASENELLKEALTHMQTGAETATNLLQDVLSASSRVMLDPHEVDLAAFAESLPEFLAQKFKRWEQVKVLVGDDLPRVTTDVRRLREVIYLLMANAMDATEDMPDAQIEICLVRWPEQGDGVMLEIADDGPGINGANIGRIFEPFFTTRKDKKRLGLGLPKVMGMTQRLGGTVEIYSQPGDGTVARVILPDHVPED